MKGNSGIEDIIKVFGLEVLITMLEDENCPGEVIHVIVEKCCKDMIILDLAVKNKNTKQEDLERIASIGSEYVIKSLISNDKMTADLLRSLLNRNLSDKTKENIINELEKKVISDNH